MVFRRPIILSFDKGLDGAGPGLGGGAGGVTPGIKRRGTGDEAASEGSNKIALCKHNEANSKVATGTA